MKIKMVFSPDFYHTNKLAIKKIREVVECTSWGGGKWTGKDLVIDPDFVKGGAPMDSLTFSGDKDKIALFTEHVEEWNAKIESTIVPPEDMTQKIKNFKEATEGMNENFRIGWAKMIQNEAVQRAKGL